MLVQTDALMQQMISNFSQTHVMVSHACMASGLVVCKPQCIAPFYLYHMHIQCTGCEAAGKQPHIVKTLLLDRALGPFSCQLATCKGLAEVEVDAVLLLLAGRICELLTLLLPALAYMDTECQHAAGIAEHML